MQKEHPAALCRVGSCWFRGVGVGKKDKMKGIKMFKMAARRNDPEAQFTLGVLLMRGVDVLQNVEKGAEYFYRCSQQGYLDSVTRFIREEDNGKASAAWIRRLQQDTGPAFHLPKLQSPNRKGAARAARPGF